MLTQSREGEIAILTLDMPERKNALSPEMRRQLIDAFERIENDGAVRAVVITGAEATFCAGGDPS